MVVTLESDLVRVSVCQECNIKNSLLKCSATLATEIHSYVILPFYYEHLTLPPIELRHWLLEPEAICCDWQRFSRVTASFVK